MTLTIESPGRNAASELIDERIDKKDAAPLVIRPYARRRRACASAEN